MHPSPTTSLEGASVQSFFHTRAASLSAPDSQSVILAGILRGSLANETSWWDLQRLHVTAKKKHQ